MERKYFCTHFDITYLSHALLLRESLIKYNPEATIFFFCMDEAAFNNLAEKNLPNTILISHNQLTTAYPQLETVKPTRSAAAYFYTSTPAICNYVLQYHPEVSMITYLDADIYFYSTYQPLFTELGDASVGIIEHRFSRFNDQLLVYGRFNVGWISFRNDATGNQCAADWLKDCLDWCEDKIEDGKYADQKYLDKWPSAYPDVKILTHKGANLATWNVRQYALSEKNGQIYVDEVPLIFYHFSRLKQIRANVFKAYSFYYFVGINSLLKTGIYDPYARALVALGFSYISSLPESYTFSRQPIQFLRNRVLEYIFKDVFTVHSAKLYASIVLAFCTQVQ